MPGRSALCRLTLACAALSAPLAAPRASAQTEVADMREDIRGLTERLNELTLRVEQLERENAELRTKVSAAEGSRDLVTTSQLNGAIAELNASVKQAVASSREEILQKVAAQMESLAKQTNAALDSVARQSAPAPAARAAGQDAAPKAEFGTSWPKDGVKYTVQKGDSLGLIAKKTGARSQDIIDANKLADPSKIQVGEVLFVPGGK